MAINSKRSANLLQIFFINNYPPAPSLACSKYTQMRRNIRMWMLKLIYLLQPHATISNIYPSKSVHHVVIILLAIVIFFLSIFLFFFFFHSSALFFSILCTDFFAYKGAQLIIRSINHEEYRCTLVIYAHRITSRFAFVYVVTLLSSVRATKRKIISKTF